MNKYWFKKRTSALDFGRPAKWQGWVALAVFVFVFALLVQMIVAWFAGGLSPAVQGVWLFGFLFIVIGGFLRICNMFSPPQDEA